MKPHLSAADTEKVANTAFIEDMSVEISTIAYYHRAGVTYDTPLYYETMVFAKGYPEIDQSGRTGRPSTCSTREEAIEQHNAEVERISKFLQARPQQTLMN